MESPPPTQGAIISPTRPRRLEELFRDLEAPLLAYATRLTRNAETAQDCVQEAFLRLHPRLTTGEVRDPSPWLYRTVHNLAVTGLRESNKIVSFDASNSGTEKDSSPRTETDLAFADPGPLPDAEVERLETAGLARLVFDRLRRIDPRAGEIVRLKFYEELSYKEIAERTGLNVGHVGYILHHALKSLATEITRSGLQR
jgi:RNA polymerase sigma-70 factor (ECF subfamily)